MYTKFAAQSKAHTDAMAMLAANQKTVATLTPMVKPAAAKPVVAKALPTQSASAPAAFSERSDTLQSLLASIKRDLKDASQL